MDFPYCGAPATPADLWERWNFDPILMAVLIAAASMHGRASGLNGTQKIFFAAGWALVGVIFISPVCALASALFSVREIHHMLLVVVIPPLLVMAGPARRLVPTNGLALTAVVTFHALVLWLWHTPQTYAAALASTPVYWIMQLSLFGSALMLWSSVLARETAPGGAIAALAASMLQTALLGAVLTFSRTPLYAFHLTTATAWNTTPLTDQQFAGVIMWVIGAVPYMAALRFVLATRVLPAIESKEARS